MPPSFVILEKSDHLSGAQIPHLYTESRGGWTRACLTWQLWEPLPEAMRTSSLGTSAAPPAASRKHRILHQTILAKNIFCSPPNSLICLPCAVADGPEKSPHWRLRHQALGRKEIPRWWGRGVGGGAYREGRSQTAERRGAGQSSSPCVSSRASVGVFLGSKTRVWVTASV